MIIELLIGFVVGFVVANIIFFSNNPKIVYVISKLTGNRQSMIKTMLESEVEYGKKHKVKYKR